MSQRSQGGSLPSYLKHFARWFVARSMSDSG